MPLTRLAPLVLGVTLMTSACGGSSSKGETDPATALKTAETKLEQTSGLDLQLKTDDLPSGVQGVKEATGTITDAPAFQGNLVVVTKLGTVKVPVVAVDQIVYARIPLTVGWTKVNPDDYGAPDPAALIDPGKGIPGMLAATTGVKAAGQVRGGADNKEVLSTYTGSVPGSVVSQLFKEAEGDFKVTYDIASDGELREASLTGVFHHGGASMTYSVFLTNYGTTADITAP